MANLQLDLLNQKCKLINDNREKLDICEMNFRFETYTYLDKNKVELCKFTKCINKENEDIIWSLLDTNENYKWYKYDYIKKSEYIDYSPNFIEGCILPLVYNVDLVIESIKEGKNVSNVKKSKRRKTIVFVESEELADLINSKSKSLVATTIHNGINKFYVTEKVSDIFKDTDIIIASQYDNVYFRVFKELFEIANSISIFNYKYIEDIDELSKKELQIAKILNNKKASK